MDNNTQEKVYVEIPLDEKEEFFNSHNFRGLGYNDEYCCIHCNEIIKVSDFKVEKLNDFLYISCPNAPTCDGTIIDFMPKSWKRKKRKSTK